jgi:hypothetical protein
MAMDAWPWMHALRSAVGITESQCARVHVMLLTLATCSFVSDTAMAS